jgi:hypothetical protein
MHTDFSELYFFLIKAPYSLFLLVAFLFYLAIIAVFACFVYVDIDGLNGADGRFDNAVWFAHETFGTIGYGILGLGRAHLTRVSCHTSQVP